MNMNWISAVLGFVLAVFCLCVYEWKRKQNIGKRVLAIMTNPDPDSDRSFSALALQTELKARYGLTESLMLLYDTLDRLQEQGRIVSWMSESIPEVGQNERRIYKLAAKEKS